MLNGFPKGAEKYIYSDKGVLSGEYCFKGTRVPVSYVLDYISKDWSVKELKRVFPSLNTAHVSAFIRLLSENSSKHNAAKKN